MSEKDLRDMKTLDEAIERAGGFVAPLDGKETHYDYRKISKYCKEKGIEPIDLTIRELNTFIVKQ